MPWRMICLRADLRFGHCAEATLIRMLLDLFSIKSPIAVDREEESVAKPRAINPVGS